MAQAQTIVSNDLHRWTLTINLNGKQYQSTDTSLTELSLYEVYETLLNEHFSKEEAKELIDVMPEQVLYLTFSKEGIRGALCVKGERLPVNKVVPNCAEIN